jgi:hypothetical protein
MLAPWSEKALLRSTFALRDAGPDYLLPYG